MSRLHRAESNVRKFFSVKRKQLLAMRDLPVCEHAGLIGGHREELQRMYLREIIPERFRIGRGMVYGPLHRSREADIVIWDAFNYPQLPMLDHSFFFAESVRVVLECKSNWSWEEMIDVMTKTQAVRDIVVEASPNLLHSIQMLETEVASLRYGQSHDGLLIVRPRIGTAAIFLAGGQTILEKFGSHVDIRTVDDSWPDVIILMEPGYIIRKRYVSDDGAYMGGHGCLEFYEANDDSLLMFTSDLLSMVMERIVQVEAPLDLLTYALEVAELEPKVRVDFPLTRIVPRVNALWSGDDTATEAED